MSENWLVKSIKEGYKQQGISEVLRLLYAKSTNIGQNCLILFALSNPLPNEKAKSNSKNHTFKFASVEDMEYYSKFPEYNLREVDIERVRTGAIKCLLQLDNDKFVGYACIWGNQLPFISHGVHLNLPDDTIYNFKSYTDPEYRGYGFQSVRHLQLLKLLKDDGVKRLFGFVDIFNSKSLRGVKKSGYVPVGKLITRRAGGKFKVKIIVNDDFWCEEVRI